MPLTIAGDSNQSSTLKARRRARPRVNLAEVVGQAAVDAAISKHRGGKPEDSALIVAMGMAAMNAMRRLQRERLQGRA